MSLKFVEMIINGNESITVADTFEDYNRLKIEWIKVNGSMKAVNESGLDKVLVNHFNAELEIISQKLYKLGQSIVPKLTYKAFASEITTLNGLKWDFVYEICDKLCQNNFDNDNFPAPVIEGFEFETHLAYIRYMLGVSELKITLNEELERIKQKYSKECVPKLEECIQ